MVKTTEQLFAEHSRRLRKVHIIGDKPAAQRRVFRALLPPALAVVAGFGFISSQTSTIHAKVITQPAGDVVYFYGENQGKEQLLAREVRDLQNNALNVSLGDHLAFDHPELAEEFLSLVSLYRAYTNPSSLSRIPGFERSTYPLAEQAFKDWKAEHNVKPNELDEDYAIKSYQQFFESRVALQAAAIAFVNRHGATDAVKETLEASRAALLVSFVRHRDQGSLPIFTGLDALAKEPAKALALGIDAKKSDAPLKYLSSALSNAIDESTPDPEAFWSLKLAERRDLVASPKPDLQPMFDPAESGFIINWSHDPRWARQDLAQLEQEASRLLYSGEAPGSLVTKVQNVTTPQNPIIDLAHAGLEPAIAYESDSDFGIGAP